MFVKLRDEKWHKAECIGSREAMDYEGKRYDMKLSVDVSSKDAESGNSFKNRTGTVFKGCHRDCVRLNG